MELDEQTHPTESKSVNRELSRGKNLKPVARRCCSPTTTLRCCLLAWSPPRLPRPRCRAGRRRHHHAAMVLQWMGAGGGMVEDPEVPKFPASMPSRRESSPGALTVPLEIMLQARPVHGVFTSSYHQF